MKHPPKKYANRWGYLVGWYKVDLPRATREREARELATKFRDKHGDRNGTKQR